MVSERQQPPKDPDFLTYSSYPSKAEGKTRIIVVGAGIIGVCVTYYITRHPKFDPKKHFITILESKRVAGGASGKAGGLLALWAFPQQIVPLSFKLHQELAEEYNGEKEWGYRRLTTISVEGDISNKDQKVEVEQREEVEEEGEGDDVGEDKISAKRPSRAASANTAAIKKNSIEMKSTHPSENRLPSGLKWIDPGFINDWSLLGDESTTAQVHPYQFTTFMLKKCLETGSVELVIGKAEDIILDEDSGECKGVIYKPSGAKAEYNESYNEKVELLGDKVVMSIGPWTSKILPDCPISGLRAHSILIKPQKMDLITPHAVFTELKLGKHKFVSPEIYSRKDEVYVCGEGDSSVLIPETTDDVEVVTEKCDELFSFVSKISSNLAHGKVVKRQACYLPVLDIPSSSGPLIGETNLENLILASGHSCWGINNAPATGLLVSEILLDGEAKSCDISALDPSLYFDASLIYDDDEDDENSDEGDESDDEEDDEDDDGGDDDDYEYRESTEEEADEEADE
ncbi:DEKNAAC103328 [Brettanomyces naardenensis]|uniref:DEKNAAC103328 n=1 Tax=Brettanomyces naardenensis TaxID=13370 RepID=A0A448YNS6_BRENA|nr:DEKNAAC103328 [Brettanomyces naardenensis]